MGLPQENVQEVAEPCGRSYYPSWSSSMPTLSPQHPIKEKANSIVFEEVGLMANSANYLLSKMSINMTVLEESVKDLQNSIKL